MNTYINNAYQLYDAVFDEACSDVSEDEKQTIEHIQRYSDNVFSEFCSEETAKKIIECRKNWLAICDEAEFQNNFYITVRSILRDIEL